MKIVIKEITQNGSSLLVYLMTDTNQPISCNITEKSELRERVDSIIKTINNKAEEMYSIANYTYEQYIKQDEQNY